MEESITLLTKIKQVFDCEGQDVRAYSPLTLAYIGDGIYELVIRSIVVERANRSANDLHKKTTRYVKAPAQSAMIEALLPELTEDEEAVYRRGRNAKSYTTAKNASVADYRRATGFEALMGYLYLTGQTDRMLDLIKDGIRLAGLEICVQCNACDRKAIRNEKIMRNEKVIRNKKGQAWDIRNLP